MRRFGRNRSRYGSRIVSSPSPICDLVLDDDPLVHMEYFEREGEGSVWSDAYLAGGKKMDKEGLSG